MSVDPRETSDAPPSNVFTELFDLVKKPFEALYDVGAGAAGAAGDFVGGTVDVIDPNKKPDQTFDARLNESLDRTKTALLAAVVLVIVWRYV